MLPCQAMGKDAHQSMAGKGRMKALTPEERSELGRKGALKRWERHPGFHGRERPVEVRVEGKWERFDSVTAASGKLGVSRTTIYGWIKKGEARYA